MTRWSSGGRWLALGLALAAGVAYFWWTRPSGPATPDSDQNVLLITIDTLRADALGSYGGRASTPNLDRLAAQGVRFTFAHAHSVVTLPSHTTILTGRLPFEHGVRDNSGYRVKDGTATLATRLKTAGFATGAFVAGFPLTKQFGLTPGFDVYDDEIPETRPVGEIAVPERQANAVVSRAKTWIDSQQGRFFAWVHVFDPHSPYKAPDEYLSRYPDRPYDAEVSWTDAALAPLLDRVAALRRPTLVIVTADHGESLGEHGELTHGMFAYEPTLRVPLIMTTLGGTSKGRPASGTIDTPARHIDIAPTVIEAAGLPVDPVLPGASLRLLVTGATSDRPSYFEALTYNIVRGWAPLTGVVSAREKYINLPIPELYDLAGDPKEERNLAPASAARVSTLAGLLDGFHASAPARPGRESAGTTAALRSLSYITGSAPAKAKYTEADDPKRLVAIDRDLQRANDLYGAGKIDETTALLRQVIATRKDTTDAYVALAHLFWESGRPKEAVATLEQALTAGAPGHEVRLRLGIYLAESGIDPRRALTVLETLPRTDAEVLNAVGVANLAAGRLEDASRAFRDVLALDPTNGMAYQNLAVVRLHESNAAPNTGERRRLLDEAGTLARQAIQADPALSKAYTTLGVAQSDAGQKLEAIDSWKRAVSIDATEFDALYNLTVTLIDTGRLDEARTYARQFVTTAPQGGYGPNIQQLRGFLGK
ncbi:MAG TPA: sulfatase-like hydrolase/transferase [Vicinamibacterales bacterium]|nr:sulfatase-like hydrolase/transferase [Vicinamibacterales bacterium]